MVEIGQSESCRQCNMLRNLQKELKAYQLPQDRLIGFQNACKQCSKKSHDACMKKMKDRAFCDTYTERYEKAISTAQNMIDRNKAQAFNRMVNITRVLGSLNTSNPEVPRVQPGGVTKSRYGGSSSKRCAIICPSTHRRCKNRATKDHKYCFIHQH